MKLLLITLAMLPGLALPLPAADSTKAWTRRWGTQSAFDDQANAGYATWDAFLTKFLRPMTNLLFTAAKGAIKPAKHMLKMRIRHDEALPLMFTNAVTAMLDGEEAGLFDAGETSWRWNKKGTAGVAKTPVGDKLRLKQAKADKRQILVTRTVTQRRQGCGG